VGCPRKAKAVATFPHPDFGGEITQSLTALH